MRECATLDVEAMSVFFFFFLRCECFCVYALFQDLCRTSLEKTNMYTI
jgi:hypothetical protein